MAKIKQTDSRSAALYARQRSRALMAEQRKQLVAQRDAALEVLDAIDEKDNTLRACDRKIGHAISKLLATGYSKTKAAEIIQISPTTLNKYLALTAQEENSYSRATTPNNEQNANTAG